MTLLKNTGTQKSKAYKWSTLEELRYLETIGTHGENETISDAQKLKLLLGRRQAIELRAKWENLNKEVITKRVDELIAQLS